MPSQITLREIAKGFKVNYRTVQRWKARGYDVYNPARLREQLAEQKHNPLEDREPVEPPRRSGLADPPSPPPGEEGTQITAEELSYELFVRSKRLLYLRLAIAATLAPHDLRQILTFLRSNAPNAAEEETAWHARFGRQS